MEDNVKTLNTSAAETPAVIGVFEGECADARITNANGLDITDQVWINVFNSSDYKRGIELGHFIGFLGHPADVDCQDFKDACIVMTNGRIDDDGKVYGEFNLINTPVGKIVKTFIDSGVTFGISVRGAGDIENNSVDPDTFVFRGFDLVAFPAYPNAIPTFTAIAASSDAGSQAKYKAVCNAVTDNLASITTSATISALKEQFAAQSEVYAQLEAREAELIDEEQDKILADEPTYEPADNSIDEPDVDTVPDDCTAEDTTDPDAEIRASVLAQKVESLTKLYAAKVQECKQIRAELNSATQQLETSKILADRRLKSMKRIMSAQLDKLQAEADSAKTELADIQSSTNTANLEYNQKIASLNRKLDKQSNVIATLRQDSSKTCRDLDTYKQRVSDLDRVSKRLSAQVEASDKIIADYQRSYAQLFGNAVGAKLEYASVTSSTTVAELKQQILSSCSAHQTDTCEGSTTFQDVVICSNNLITI